MNNKKLRGLWLSRELPFPLDSGDKIYSARLARSLAEAGAELALAGLVPEDEPDIPADWPIRWHPIAGRRNGTLPSLLSPMPLVAAVHATDRYRHEVAALALEPWDFVVFDQYGTGFALEPFLELRREAGGPVLIHVAHDHEASVCGMLYREFRGSPLKRLGLWQNWLKVRAFERSLAARMDLVTAITDEDAARFEADAPKVPTVVLKPGHDGEVSRRAAITPATPRRVVMVGSFHWTAKQENLRRFVAVADPVFAERGIELHVAGSMPPELAAELAESCRATRLHGFVDDIAPLFESARIAVVPEMIGGGFKLKFLDYIFGRVPVATLSHAAAGLPEDIRAAMLCRDDLERLVAGIGALMDDLERLNRMQERALAAAEALFRWPDRGAALLSAIRAAREFGRIRREPVPLGEPLPRTRG
jgi:glycosyltransferase involved in cell wall biosynthesis